MISNPRNILKIPGHLVVNPTNLSLPFPYGGTALGVCRDIAFSFGQKVDYPIAEEFKAPVAAILQGEDPVLACVLRSWDNDMLAVAWHNIQTSAFDEVGVNGRVAGSGIKRAGYNLAARAVTILFCPHAEDQHQFILMYQAVPMLGDTAELQMSIGREFGMALMFKGLPDNLGRTYSMDLKDNLTL